MPPSIAAAIATTHRQTSRISQSSANAYARTLRPAGRSSSRMPSGVSTGTTVSRASGRPASGLDDDGVRNLVMQTLAGLGKDEQRIDHAVRRDDAYHPVEDVAEPNEPPQRSRRAVAAHHFDPNQLLADRLAVARHRLDVGPTETHEPDESGDKAADHFRGIFEIVRPGEDRAHDERQVYSLHEEEAVENRRPQTGTAIRENDSRVLDRHIVNGSLGRSVRVIHRALLGLYWASEWIIGAFPTDRQWSVAHGCTESRYARVALRLWRPSSDFGSAPSKPRLRPAASAR